MATYSELQTRVNRRIIDLPAAITAEVPTLVNEAMRELQDRHNFRVMRAEASFTTVAATRALGALPSDFKAFRSQPYLVRDLGDVKRLRLAPDRLEASMGFALDTALDVGEPTMLLVAEATTVAGATQLEVWPLSDTASDYDDGEYRIQVPYWKYLPALSASGDTNWFTVNADLYLVYKATAQGFSLDWDENRMLVWETKAAAELKRIVMQEKTSVLSENPVLVPYPGVNAVKLGL